VKKNRNVRPGQRGFTLVEMMVVIVIIGILATVVIVNISGKADKARVEATQALLKQLGGQMEMFKLDHNRYPENLNDLYKMPSYVDPKKWPGGGYITEQPMDGWGKEFYLRIPGPDNSPFDIVSLGEDGLPGGEGVNADLWSHRVTK
jgi:general secretion pathway protein G